MKNYTSGTKSLVSVGIGLNGAIRKDIEVTISDIAMKGYKRGKKTYETIYNCSDWNGQLRHSEVRLFNS